MRIIFKHWDCIAVGQHYLENNRKAISLIDDIGETIAKATTNIPGYKLSGDIVFIKEWGENEGMAAALIAAEIIKLAPVTSVESGYTTVFAYKLTKKALKNLWTDE